MPTPQEPDSSGSEKKEYKRFAARRIIAGVLITAVVIWVAGLLFSFFDNGPDLQADRHDSGSVTHTDGHASSADAAAHSAGDHAAGADTVAHETAGDKKIDRYKTLFARKVSDQGGHLPVPHTQLQP